MLPRIALLSPSMRDKLKPKRGPAGDDAPARGLAIPAPRPTPWAAIYAALYLGVPLIAALALVDLVLYLVFRYGFDRCYGIGCLL